MQRIRTLIVDDEESARDRLLVLLQEEEGVEIAGLCQNGHEAIRLIKEGNVDLLFLDIQMPGMDGFSTLRQIPTDQVPVIIFVTAYDKYAVRAFESQAFDYLLKPFSNERFKAALERSRRHLQTHATSELGVRLARLLNETGSVPPAAKTLDQIVLKESGRVRFLSVKDLDWIEADDVYVRLHAGVKSYLYRAALGQLQQRLDPRQFIRVNRSAIINTERIMELRPHSHGEYIIVLKNGAQVPLKRAYRAQLEGWLQQSL